jgi:hypothetical protein
MKKNGNCLFVVFQSNFTFFGGLEAIQKIRDTLRGEGKQQCHQMTQGGGGVFKNVTWHWFGKKNSVYETFLAKFRKGAGNIEYGDIENRNIEKKVGN